MGWKHQQPGIGIGLTLIYLTSMCAIVVLNWETFSQLEPNAWGDFLAGSLGLLALFWLILGYFQQGKELKNSVDALKRQAAELAAASEQQRQLVKSNERIAELETERFHGSLRIERSKLIADVQNDMIAIPSLMSAYKSAQSSLLELVNKASGNDAEQIAMDSHSFDGGFSKLKEDVDAWAKDKPATNQRELEEAVAAAYRIRGKSAFLRSSIERQIHSLAERERLIAIKRNKPNRFGG
ncbi:hypothetical protein [Roseobacter sinensis]|uniref:Uncharacterized protein n=1 Tax=Roseobacter sinensis TaxID=2931391 RepID=A0ABT3BH73_9RHOB|nr:hypothetical protein [Roseobacter sp. WL0113]MCV3272932.1 hypothetical protein [Roseobacter sp. WL0113]